SRRSGVGAAPDRGGRPGMAGKTGDEMTERRPRGRRTAVVAVLVAGLVVALVVGAAALAWHELRPGDNTPAAASEPATFSDYADRLVDSTPGAWRATDDVVVVPDDAAGETSGS